MFFREETNVQKHPEEGPDHPLEVKPAKVEQLL